MSKGVPVKKIIAVLLIVICLPFLLHGSTELKNDTIKIGYFHGGRTMLLYRALVHDFFEKEGLTAIFYSKDLYSDIWKEYTKESGEAAISKPKAGKATGIELNKLMFDGKVDMSFIGEAAFVRSCALGEPILAIAQLGADHPQMGGHVIVLKKGVKIKGPKDLESITWGTRRSSGGDDVFLKEFLLKEGADLSKVKIISGIADDKLQEYMMSGKIQGGYYHLMSARNEERHGIVYTYRKLDWINPETSQSLAVVSRSYFEKNKEPIKKFLRAYMKRISYEHSLPKKVRRKAKLAPGTKTYTKYLYEMEMDYKGMNLPQYPKIPTVKKDLVNQITDMLFRHKFIDKKVVIENCYDNSLAKEVAAELYPKEVIPE